MRPKDQDRSEEEEEERYREMWALCRGSLSIDLVSGEEDGS